MKIGYEYLNSVYSGSIKDNRKYVIGPFYKIWDQYILLKRQIEKYSFDAKWYNSKGAIQNKINGQILDQLSLFQPLIHDICLTASEKMENQELSKEFKEQLLVKLDNLFEELDDMKLKLSYAKDEYHEDWSHCVRPYAFSRRVSVNDLGKSSSNWRKTRNEACYTMLKFVCEMIDIYIAIYYNTFDYKNEQYGLDEDSIRKINYYNECLKYIQHSNNYFCYLNEEDKQEVAFQKIKKNRN